MFLKKILIKKTNMKEPESFLWEVGEVEPPEET